MFNQAVSERAPLLAGLRSLLQPGLPKLFKSKLQRGRQRLYQKLSVAVTNYIISVHAGKSYAINAVSGFTKKCLLVMYQTFLWCPVTRIWTENLPVSFTTRNQKGRRTQQEGTKEPNRTRKDQQKNRYYLFFKHSSTRRTWQIWWGW